jgi:CHAT domain-containing protein
VTQDAPGFVWHVQTELGNSLLDRFEGLRNSQDLDAAIACYRYVLSNAGDEIDYRESLEGSLGGALLTRYGLSADPGDIEDCVAAYAKSLTGSHAVTGTRRERILANYGLALYYLHLWSLDVDVLNTAIEQFEKLEDGEDLTTRANALSNLGIALRARFKATHEPQDLEASIAAQAEALRWVEAGSFKWGKWLSNLGNAVYSRFELLGNQGDLEDALAAYESALEALPATAPEWASTNVNLGSTLAGRFDRFGELADIDAAIEAFEQASEASPPGSGTWSRGLSYLAAALRLRFFVFASRDDLDAAVEIVDQLQAGARPGTPAWFIAQSAIGMVYRTRFGFLGHLPDLEHAVSVHQEVLASAPAGSNAWALGHFGLGEALLTRYKALGDFAGLEAAIDSFRSALGHLPPSSIDHAGALASLGEALDLRYQGTQELDNVDESIALHQRALLAVRPGSLKWTRWHTGLGIALSLRYDALRDEKDLEASVSALKEALSVTTTQHGLDWASAQVELAGILIQRYRNSKRREDLDEAVQGTVEALSVLAPGSAERSFCLLTRADAFRFRFADGGKQADFESSAQAYQELLNCLDAEIWPERVFAAVSGFAELNATRGDWNAAAASWRQAIGVANRRYQSQVYQRGREANLRRDADIHQRAAYAYARAGLLEEAVVVLETGRARAMSEGLARDRADLERVRELDPEGYELYVAAAGRLRQLEGAERGRGQGMADSVARTTTDAAVRPVDHIREEVRNAQVQLQAAIARIRKLTDYEDFLAEPDWEDIVDALERDGSSPLVYLVSSRAGGIALLAGSDRSVEVLWLDGLTAGNTRDLLSGSARGLGWAGAYEAWLRNPGDRDQQQAWFDVLDATCRHLWDQAMAPIVAALRSRGKRRAVLIPTGLLALLPFHAAWTPDAASPGKRSYALDAISFSFAPNARSLRAARMIAERTPAASLLAVSDPKPTCARPLAHAAAEAQAAVMYFPESHLLAEEQATREAVLELLPGYSVLHFSGHGRANVASPLESGLLMAGDGLLSVGDLFNCQFPGIRLAVLSACETNLPGLDLPDEALGLAAVLLNTGIAGVAASLWSVEDLSTMMLLARFYDFWRGDGLEPAEALQQAQIWVRDTTSQNKAVFFKDHRPDLFDELIFSEPQKYAHPFYWAAFTYVGI